MSVVTEQLTQRFGEVQPERPLKFVFFPLGYVLAHVGRTVEIAKVLRAQGHEVVFAGEDPSHPRSRLSHIIKAGFPVVKVKEPMWYRAWDRFHNHGALCGVYDFFTSQKWAPLDEILEDIIRVCEEEQPDMIVGDSSVGVSTAGHILGIPAAGVLNAYNTHFFRPWSFYRGLIRTWDWLYLSRIRGRVNIYVVELRTAQAAPVPVSPEILGDQAAASQAEFQIRLMAEPQDRDHVEVDYVPLMTEGGQVHLPMQRGVICTGEDVISATLGGE